VGGDFNCTENGIDRNHVEPHMQSRKTLIHLRKSHSIIDIWRNFHVGQRQYTWIHAFNNQLMARFDRFYGFKHQLSMFRECSIVPVSFSDHSLVKLWQKNMLNLKVHIGILTIIYWVILVLETFLKNFGKTPKLRNRLSCHCSSGGILQRFK